MVWQKIPTRIPLFNTKAYVLKDDSGEITILTEADLPKMNEKITVRVKVANIAIINGESSGNDGNGDIAALANSVGTAHPYVWMKPV